jgi:hypothetical protein
MGPMVSTADPGGIINGEIRDVKPMDIILAKAAVRKKASKTRIAVNGNGLSRLNSADGESTIHKYLSRQERINHFGKYGIIDFPYDRQLETQQSRPCVVNRGRHKRQDRSIGSCADCIRSFSEVCYKSGMEFETICQICWRRENIALQASIQIFLAIGLAILFGGPISYRSRSEHAVEQTISHVSRMTKRPSASHLRGRAMGLA